MNNIVLIFAGITFLNVILSTAKSILTIKGGKGVASVSNAINYGVNTFAVFLISDPNLSIETKIIISVVANLVGVYIVKWLEDKIRKDRDWVFDATICCTLDDIKYVKDRLSRKNIDSRYIEITPTKYDFRAYSTSKSDSRIIKNELDFYEAKYHSVETV